MTGWSSASSKAGNKFKTRYATLGFSDEAKLDEGEMSPTSFALKRLTADIEERIGTLVKRAVSSVDREQDMIGPDLKQRVQETGCTESPPGREMEVLSQIMCHRFLLPAGAG